MTTAEEDHDGEPCMSCGEQPAQVNGLCWFCDDTEEDRPPVTDTIHECPPGDGSLTPCCGRTPFELPATDRMTAAPALVTCERSGKSPAMTETATPPSADASPVARLRAAADLLERLDCDATPGRWMSKPCVLGTTTLHAGPNEAEIGDLEDADDAALIVSLRSLAPHLTAWLRGEAAVVEADAESLQLNDPSMEAEARRHVMEIAVSPHATTIADAVLASAPREETRP